MIPFSGFASVGILVETQIAVGFAFAQFRYTRALRMLRQSLPLCWLIGICLGCFSNLSGEFDEKAGICTTSTQMGYHEALPILLVVSFGISIIAYATTLGSSIGEGMPSSVAAKIRTRNLVYPLNFFFTCGMGLVVSAFPDLMSSPEYGKLFLATSLLPHNLNGFLNALTYAWIFYGSRRLTREDDSPEGTQPLQQRSHHDDEDDPLGFASFHVGFGENHLVIVPAECSGSSTSL